MLTRASGAAAALPPVMAWTGPGRTAFAGPAGARALGAAREILAPQELPAAFGAGGDAAFTRALRAYFQAGGGPCWVLNLPPLASLPADRRAAAWVGHDGKPGYRTGLFALCDVEEVGTIVLAGLLDREVRRAAVAALAAREDRFVVLDALTGGGAEELPPAERAAVVEGWTVDADGGRVPPSGGAMACIEASDFREDRPENARLALGRPGHPTLGGGRYPTVEAWRLHHGLRRSIDLGTRWVVFEEDGERLWRRVEREVKAFLGRLHRLGLLEGRSSEEAFRVLCEGDARAARGFEGRVLLKVEVRWRGRPAAAAGAAESDAAPGTASPATTQTEDQR